jgi:hypothetical protein
MSLIQSPRRLLLVALALGALVDLLFYDKPPGISVFLFVSLLLVALFALGRGEGVRPVRANLWLVPPLLFFAAMVFVRANEFLTVLNVVAVLLLLGLVAHFFAAGRFEHLSIAGFLGVPFRAAGNALWRAAPLLPAAVDVRAVRVRGGRSFFPVLRGLLLAAPVVLVFALLLASADLVFERWISRLINFEISVEAEELFWRGVEIVCAAWFLAGALVYAFGRARATENGDRPAPKMPLGFVEAATVLVSVNALFLCFVAIQFAYLFGGDHRNVVGGEFTYAQYARRGFFELVLVSVLSLGLIGGLRGITRREPGAQTRAFNVLGTILSELVLVLLASAWERMRLYESAYGYTEQRLVTQVFMIWLAVVFVWFQITLWLRSERFAVGVFGCCVGFLATLNLINLDAYVARQNIARYEKTGKLDVGHLAGLSPDAVPILVRSAAPLLRGSDAQTLWAALRYRRETLEAEERRRSWPSFHLARRRAYEALNALLAGSAPGSSGL